MIGDFLEIRVLNKNEIKKATKLVLEVFLEFDAPDYTQEGVKDFYNSIIKNQVYLNSLTFYGAVENGEVLGVIATRNGGNHIALFYVSGLHHGKKIGRKLFETAISNSPTMSLTVNASPFGVPIYEHLGFKKLKAEQNKNGLRFTPMKIRR